MARRGGRRWRRLVAYVLDRDNRVCWRCGRGGADTGGHVLPVTTHPHLEYDPRNVRAEHGTRRTITEHGYECAGNYAMRDQPPPTTQIRSRAW